MTQTQSTELAYLIHMGNIYCPPDFGRQSSDPEAFVGPLYELLALALSTDSGQVTGPFQQL